MGALLAILKGDGKRPAPGVFVDFENAQPTEPERALFDQVRTLLAQSEGVLRELEEYQGAGDHIRNAITNSSDQQVQLTTWAVVSPLVLKLHNFHQFSLSLENSLDKLYQILCSEAPGDSLVHFQALAKQFAEILHFTLKFDELKMSNPAIQNDFSFYRRNLNRMKQIDLEKDSAVVSDEEANRMSLFYAYPTPMLKCVSDTTAAFVRKNRDVPVENTTEMLSVMANVCREMIENPEYTARFQLPAATTLFCKRVMVGAIVLYDLVHEVGAFSKKNPSIDIRACVRALRMGQGPEVEGLLNALRYTTKHLNDEDTPKAIKQLLQ